MGEERVGDDSLEKFLTFQREVNRLFRRIFEEGSQGEDLEGDALSPKADVNEGEHELTVEIETPGSRPSDLTLWVSRDLIVLEGEKPHPARPAARFHCLERDFGKFRRVLEIPCPVDTRRVTARYRAGLLTVKLPKIEDQRGERRKVAITVST